VNEHTLAPPGRTPSSARYFEHVDERRGPLAEAEPVCLYLETTNRCNLLCTTCPRTFEQLEPPADMSWELFTSIVDQFPRIARVVLHGVGEPMMVRTLPRMIRYLKDRGVYVLFNTNGTLLTQRAGQELIVAGLDELRISLDAATPKTFALVRGRDLFSRILRNVRRFTTLQGDMRCTTPRVSLWLTGLKETIAELPAFVRLAHELGVPEVYLQRLVYFPDDQGLARSASALFAHRLLKPRRSQSPSVSPSTPRVQPSPARACASSRTSSPGRCAAALGPSCTSRRTAKRCRAASRRFRCAATPALPSATPLRRPCARSGTARVIRTFDAHC